MRKLLYLIIPLTIVLSGCEEFLVEKTNKKLVVPNSLRDVQALLDAYANLNVSDPGDGEVASDDYYLTDGTWSSLRNEQDRRAYTWEPDFSTTFQRWWVAYRNIYYANVALESLEKIDIGSSEQRQRDNIKGQALFLRAKGFFSVAAIWALAYDEVTATTAMGIPLRLSSDYNIISDRASLQESYDRIINDLKEAADLLPDDAETILRASKPASMALLARTYLFMRDYKNCLQFADACLKIRSDLLDYNDLNPTVTYPMPDFVHDNREILYASAIAGNLPLSINRALIDTNLYRSYDAKDLRKSLFFRDNGNGTFSFRGSYMGASLFSGISLDEVFLMRSECRARLGDINGAMDDLNHLLKHRYSDDVLFIPLTADTFEEALQYILNERRKELLFRGLRFPDVKRLNMEGANISFKRILGGIEYVLSPNDLRFALSIPENVIELEPRIIQNPR